MTHWTADLTRSLNGAPPGCTCSIEHTIAAAMEDRPGTCTEHPTTTSTDQPNQNLALNNDAGLASVIGAALHIPNHEGTTS